MSAVIRRRPTEISGRLCFLDNNPSPFVDSIIVSDSMVVPIGFASEAVPEPGWQRDAILVQGVVENRDGKQRFLATKTCVDHGELKLVTEPHVFPTPFVFE